VAREVERDREANPDFGVHSCADEDRLFNHFNRGFTVEKFFAVFYWLFPIVDLEKSTPFGLWYARRKLI
jgi:hypothetical protein